MPEISQPKVSVIIPAFNAQDFIHVPLTALKTQTYKNFEVIVVNDGSTDLTYETAEKHASDFSDINIINQPNRGVSSARNTGIRNAKGIFVVFVDSDDRVEPNFLAELVKRQEETNGDVIYCGFYKWGKTGSRRQPQIFSETNVLHKRLRKELSFHVGCLMVRKELLTSHSILFDEDLTLGEDLLFIYTILCYTRIYAVEKYLYHHLYRNDSVTNAQWKEKDYKNNIVAMCTIRNKISSLYSNPDREDVITLLQLEQLDSQLSYLWRVMLTHNFELAKQLIHDGYLDMPRKVLAKINDSKRKKKIIILKTQSTILWRIVSFLSINRKKLRG